jgi:hypothetical protein
MPSSKRQPASQTANRDAYRGSFLRHVHRLLQLGYESLVPTGFTNAEEDDITGEICKHMKRLTEEEPSEKWMAHYSIHDQDPVNDKLHPVTSKVRRGKWRPRLDIRLVNKASVPNPRFCVEAKRLYRSDSVTEYMDDEGLGAFVGGYYAKTDSAAGMVGYVQVGSIADWLPKIQRKLSENTNSQSHTNGEVWRLSRFRQGPLHTYQSFHRRHNTSSQLEVLHTFFAFC